MMISAQRMRAKLDADKLVLEGKLKEALAAKREQITQSQHLRELRADQNTKLSRLRASIEEEQDEIAAIQARSAELAQSLAPPAPDPAAAADAPPPASDVALASGSSGFAWPVSGAVTSGYGYRWGRLHAGIDVDCVTGTPIRASRSGTVESASYDSGYGNHIVIQHGAGYATLYAHNTTMYVGAGQSVSQGETIATCGATGSATGDHLHFEIRVNGSPQDPLAYLP